MSWYRLPFLGEILFLLKKIKEIVWKIKEKLDDKEHGLKEIKCEIKDIEKKLDNMVPISGIRSTGPVIRDNSVGSVVGKVFNATSEEVTVTVQLLDLTECPAEIFSEVTLTVDPCCAEEFIFPTEDPPVQLPDQFAVVFRNAGPGIQVFAAGRTQSQQAPFFPSNLVAPNTFRDGEIVAKPPGALECIPDDDSDSDLC